MAGYEKVAALMAKHSEVATYQRFEFLNMLDLLYRQAELVHLEGELRDSMKLDLESGEKSSVEVIESGLELEKVGRGQDKEVCEAAVNEVDEQSRWSGDEINSTPCEKEDIDRRSMMKSESRESVSNDLFEGTRDWWYLSHAENGQTWDIMLRTREKLKEYNEALLRQTQLKAHASPNDCDVRFLRRWFTDPKMGDFPLIGKDSTLYATSPPSSLLALQPRTGDDPLSSLFLSKVCIWYHNLLGRHIFKLKLRIRSQLSREQPFDTEAQDDEAQYFEYGDKQVLRAANVVGSVISSGLLVGSIVALYFVHDTLVRLGIIAVFTQLFSLVLVCVTRARKVEVFAATAAFMAVQVVFVGSTYPVAATAR